MQDLIERLRALHVWPQSTADEYADTLTPRRIAALYEVGKVAHEAAEALTTAQAENEALKAELAAALAKVEKLREGLQDIAWPARLPSDGDPTVLRNHALATLAETQPERNPDNG